MHLQTGTSPRLTLEAHAPDARVRLEAICGRPELLPLTRGVAIRISETEEGPFHVRSSVEIQLARTVVGSPALPVVVRHALEIAAALQACPRPRPLHAELAAAALASWTAAEYADLLPDDERAKALAASPGWLRHAARLAHRRQDDLSVLASWLARRAVRLLPLQGVDGRSCRIDADVLAGASVIIADLLVVACPTERLLTMGGDSRLIVDPHSRLNKYGCSATPRPSALAFSSCTASSASERGFAAAEGSRAGLLGAVLGGATLQAACAAETEEIRQGISTFFGLDRVPGADVLLAASGTDCELYALHLALETCTGDLLSIVIGPDEIGSGSVAAAGGRHFDSTAPLARAVAAGTAVEGMDATRVRVECVPLRNATGLPLSARELDAAVEQCARAAAARGQRVLLHVVDSSKTGLRAPTAEAIARLRRAMGSSLLVLVDAAQVRTSVRKVGELLRTGAMVAVSGSKFMCGTPFSGALLVPPQLAAAGERLAAAPAGLRAYLSALDVPSRWARFRDGLPSTPNIGLLLRWRTALAEMQAFEAVDEAAREECLRVFRETVVDRVRRRPRVHLVPGLGHEGVRTNHPPSWDEYPTIFTFVLAHVDGQGGASGVLTYEEAWQVYVALNRDMSALLPADATDADRGLAALPCHIGQPVRIRWVDGSVRGALRIAAGAPFVSRAVFDRSLGRTRRARIATQMADIERIIDKADLIVRHWPQFSARSAVA